MNNRGEAKRILKLYGKAEYAARVEYVNSFMDKSKSNNYGISWKYLTKRGLAITAMLVLLFAMTVVVVSAFGFHVPGFNLTEYNDHTEIMRNEEDVVTDETRLYEPTYVPKGYKLVQSEDFMGCSLENEYKNKAGYYLHIDQTIADYFAGNFNNEDCTRGELEINGTKVMAYYYNRGGAQYVMTMKGTVIVVDGLITDEEFKKIIRGLK